MNTATDHIARGVAHELLRRHNGGSAAVDALSPAEAELCCAAADQVMAQLPDLFDRLSATKQLTDVTIEAGR